jgi:peptidoglycan/LPS O-acetylase OafA/YrhL
MGYEERGPRPGTWPARYALLDGLRGLACLGVVLHHLGVAPIGHYCVMVFFVVSGYCIAAAASSGLRNGASLVILHLLLATGFWWLFERPFVNKRPSAVAQPADPGANRLRAIRDRA